MKDLKDIRVEIDAVDKQIVELYKKRLGLACDVAEYKISVGKKVYDKEREIQKLDSLSLLSADSFEKQGIFELFSQIMANSRKKQYQILAAHGIKFENEFTEVFEYDFSNAKVCFQGVEGAYSQMAMDSFFRNSMKESFHVDTWREAMESIEKGAADYAVLPIENSSAGSIAENYDLLSEYDVSIIGEQLLKVDHALLGVKGASITDIKTVYSHPQALAQCDEYIRSQHMDWEVKAFHNTAVSAKKVFDDNDISQAAIGSKLNAKLYGLDILEEQIQDIKNNETRFIIVSKDKTYKSNSQKISLMIEIKHEMGSLYRILSHFMFNGLNMSCIESRPIKDMNWQYRFFIDVDGNLNDDAVANALSGLQEECETIKILGNY